MGKCVKARFQRNTAIRTSGKRRKTRGMRKSKKKRANNQLRGIPPVKHNKASKAPQPAFPGKEEKLAQLRGKMCKEREFKGIPHDQIYDNCLETSEKTWRNTRNFDVTPAGINYKKQKIFQTKAFFLIHKRALKMPETRSNGMR